jgi:TonB-dependent starch-binding outer membrane protein SusC
MESFYHAWLSVGTDDESMTNWGGMGLESIASYFTRLNYDYNNRYFSKACFRMDGSSKFGPENRWGAFPAFSLGWVVSEEAFMRDVPS